MGKKILFVQDNNVRAQDRINTTLRDFGYTLEMKTLNIEDTFTYSQIKIELSLDNFHMEHS